MSARMILSLAVLLPILSAGTAIAQDAVPLRRGSVFPNFSATDAVSGKKFQLEDFRGRVVLLDFWATWCRPCIAELPNVKQAYAKYHEQGLEIISISLDNRPAVCLEYAKDNNLDWLHVIEGGGWKTRLAREFRVTSIPAMYVLDPQGKIISVKPRGPALDAALREAIAMVDAKDLPAADDDDAGDDAGDGTDQKREIVRDASLRRLERARQQIKDGQSVNGYFALEEVVRRYPDTKAAEVARVEMASLLHDPAVKAEVEEAVKRRVQEAYEKEADGLLRMARTLAGKNQPAEARKYYATIIRRYPTSTAAKSAAEELAKLPE